MITPKSNGLLKIIVIRFWIDISSFVIRLCENAFKPALLHADGGSGQEWCVYPIMFHSVTAVI